MNDNQDLINLRIVFLPSREFIDKQIIEDLDPCVVNLFNYIKFEDVKKILTHHLPIKYAKYRSYLIDPNCKIEPTMKFYKMKNNQNGLNSIQELLLKNINTILNCETIEVNKILELISLDSTIKENQIEENEIIFCEYYQYLSLFTNKNNKSKSDSLKIHNNTMHYPTSNNSIMKKNNQEAIISRSQNLTNELSPLDSVSCKNDKNIKNGNYNRTLINDLDQSNIKQYSIDRSSIEQIRSDQSNIIDDTTYNLLDNIIINERNNNNKSNQPSAGRSKSNRNDNNTSWGFNNDNNVDKQFGHYFNDTNEYNNKNKMTNESSNNNNTKNNMNNREKSNNSISNRRPIGLANIGNTCYINATFQCLFGCKELIEYFKSNAYEKDLIPDNNINTRQLLYIYVELLQKVTNSNEYFTSYSPNDFICCFKHFFKQFDNEDHHDMEEFFLVLIEYLMSWLNTTSLLHRFFNGMLKNSFECAKCKTITVRKESFITMNVSLADFHHPTIDCYFNFNNNQTNPIVFQYKMTENLTIREMNRVLTKALCIPSNSLYIVLFNKDKFENVTETSCPLNDLIINKEDKLCFLLINIDLYQSSINIATVENIFLNFSEINFNSQIDLIKPLEISHLVKCIFIQEIYTKNNNGASDLLPNVIYISKDTTFEYLYDYLIQYYSTIHFDLNKNMFHQKKDLTIDTTGINPFIIIFDIVQPINSSISSLKSRWQRMIIPFNVEKNIEFLIKKNKSKQVYNIQNNSSFEIVFSVLWNPDRENILYARNQPRTLILTDLNPSYNIEDCLENFFKRECLGNKNKVECDKCQSKQSINKMTEILQLPELLIINLKRLHNNEKITSLIQFPLYDLNINKFLSSDISKEKYQFGYELFAVGNHEQIQLHKTGHYTAYVRNNDDYVWYEISDDQKNQEIKENKIVTPNAYILFYQKQAD